MMDIKENYEILVNVPANAGSVNSMPVPDELGINCIISFANFNDVSYKIINLRITNSFENSPHLWV